MTLSVTQHIHGVAKVRILPIECMISDNGHSFATRRLVFEDADGRQVSLSLFGTGPTLADQVAGLRIEGDAAVAEPVTDQAAE